MRVIFLGKLKEYGGLANRRFRPLSHLSADASKLPVCLYLQALRRALTHQIRNNSNTPPLDKKGQNMTSASHKQAQSRGVRDFDARNPWADNDRPQTIL